MRQASWTRSYLAPTRTGGETRHALPLEVLSEILSGRTGRLERALATSEGPATSVGAGYDSSAIDPSTFNFYGSPRPGIDLAALEAAIDKQIAALLKDGVTEAEVTRAKTSLIAGATYARDSAASGARLFGAGLVAGLTIEQIEAWPDLVRAVTVADVNLAARAVQHESDHLDGVLFIDRMTETARRELDPVINDFEAQFRRWQAEGRYPSDEILKRDLLQLEPKPPAASPK